MTEGTQENILFAHTISEYKIFEKLRQQDGRRVDEGGNPARVGQALSCRKLMKRIY